MKKLHFTLSWSYWFSSRSLGLLTHPYLTVGTIVRQRFMRPLILLPTVVWGLSWISTFFLIRLESVIHLLIHSRFSPYINSSLLFLFVWATVFLAVWQLTLGYLYFRFYHLPQSQTKPSRMIR